MSDTKKSYLRFGDVGQSLYYYEFNDRPRSTLQIKHINSLKPSRPEYEHFDRLGQMWQCTVQPAARIGLHKSYNCLIVCYRKEKIVFQLHMSLFNMAALYNDNCMWIQDFGSDKIAFISYQTLYH